MLLDKDVVTPLGTVLGALLAILGGVAGAAGAVWAALVNTRAQVRLAQVNAERDHDRQAAEHAHLVRARLLDRGLDRLEPAYVSLAAIARRVSLTGLTVHETAERDVPALDALHEELGARLDEVTMALGLYAAGAQLSTEALSNAVNRHWGAARDRLRLWDGAAPATPDPQSVSDVNARLLNAEGAIKREVGRLQSGILAAVSAQRAAALPEPPTSPAGHDVLKLR